MVVATHVENLSTSGVPSVTSDTFPFQTSPLDFSAFLLVWNYSLGGDLHCNGSVLFLEIPLFLSSAHSSISATSLTSCAAPFLVLHNSANPTGLGLLPWKLLSCWQIPEILCSENDNNLCSAYF